jgi:hypothetical protein
LVHAHCFGSKASDARNPDRHGRDRRSHRYGLVASLPRPGGNVTGIASGTAELAGKSVQLIRDMLPSARRVTVLVNATVAGAKAARK